MSTTTTSIPPRATARASTPASGTPTTARSPAKRASNSFAATASSESSRGSGVASSVSSGVVAGVLAGTQAVDVPLNGPGSWALTASAPVATRLVCPRANTSFAQLIVIDSSQTCQLLITSATSETATWRLAPQP